MSKHVKIIDYGYGPELTCNIDSCPESALDECNLCNYRQEILAKLKYYEDLEEQGRLIELPCKVGETVWTTRWWDNKMITKKIDGVTWCRYIFQHKITKEKFSLHDIDRIGNDVFLTKAEAEAKLAELKGEE
jgi:hypothetical protein